MSALAFYNASHNEITQVSVTAKANGKRVSCSTIDVKNHCGTGFPVKVYQGGELVVRWTTRSGQHITRTVTFEMDDSLSADIKYVAVIKVLDHGSIETKFIKNPRVF